MDVLVRCRVRAVGRWVSRRTADRTGDSGQITAFAVLLCIVLIAVAGLVLDAGIAISAKVRALDVAQSAARAGAQQLDLVAYRTHGVAHLDPARATAAARRWLATAAVAGDATATATTVTVTVRADSRTQILRVVGVNTLHVSATASATAVQGVTGPTT